jgi:hypothetical protein
MPVPVSPRTSPPVVTAIVPVPLVDALMPLTEPVMGPFVTRLPMPMLPPPALTLMPSPPAPSIDVLP